LFLTTVCVSQLAQLLTTLPKLSLSVQPDDRRVFRGVGRHANIANLLFSSKQSTGAIVITIKEVEHVAKLARLTLTDEEKERFAQQLGKIIDHFNELKNVDTTNVEPLAHVLPITNVLREDVVVSPPGSAVLLENAPDQENGFFRVPKIGD
jgi:aspartyl-tRNA(Asn)/glutamyl-tRNA(Gln) amidotransferase subunit C